VDPDLSQIYYSRVVVGHIGLQQFVPFGMRSTTRHGLAYMVEPAYESGMGASCINIFLHCKLELRDLGCNKHASSKITVI